ncbi:hypothetical protein [Plasmodium yoelii yoelii]|uniref:Uncharacterized protein n=1 Tax=Plasmodium yoelii yoelii TaxID=73239 RepID=Q7RIX9_PLAYO|nr:hypothetical protein [Plasmodium yoelii yoelii]
MLVFAIWMKKGIEKKNMKEVINLVSGKKTEKRVINSTDRKK